MPDGGTWRSRTEVQATRGLPCVRTSPSHPVLEAKVLSFCRAFTSLF